MNGPGRFKAPLESQLDNQIERGAKDLVGIAGSPLDAQTTLWAKRQRDSHAELELLDIKASPAIAGTPHGSSRASSQPAAMRAALCWIL